ncbi:hypothetical protein [Primorskyibacter flagellatus]|uniref:hypothetical protein n=1 Tax=Primorskyibacter flagellatus TaxID=1387277 RepID=UPI001669A1B8|nr:hypothetical protein [Primorskyibacter flagellatus]
MIDESDFQRRKTEALLAFRKAFGGDPKALEPALRRAGRRLPRRARKAGARLVGAEQMLGNPKLQQQVDAKQVNRDFDRLIAGVSGVDMKDRRKGWVLGALASLAFNLLLLFTLFVLFARWRGWL